MADEKPAAVKVLEHARQQLINRIDDEKASHESYFTRLTESRNAITRMEAEVQQISAAIHQLNGTRPIPDNPQG